MKPQKGPRLHYKNNPNLKGLRVSIPFRAHQIEEYQKCEADPIYFISNYAKIISLDRGAVLFKPFPYQIRLITAMHENRKVIGKLFRQSGKSTCVAAYIAWYLIFNKEKKAAILANKAKTAKEIFSRLQYIIECLPFWLQQGVVSWNKTSFELENKSVCYTAASSPSAVRGDSINLLFLDEFGILASNLADEFIASVFPTISSSKTSKLIIVSTPKGLNHFHKLWIDAEQGKNGFVTVSGHYKENPERDEKWVQEQLIELGELRFNQEILCEFLGSSKSLISGAKLGSIATIEPIFAKDNLKFYKKPEKGKSYACIVDTSRGQHLDYSAFTIIDISQTPYEVCATFKDNKISIQSYPFLILNTCKQYNDAYALIEINDAGGEIANTLWYEYEYENVYFTDKERLSESSGYPGVRTTKKVKMNGCSILKDLIEGEMLIINSHDILQELGVFVQKRSSYAAENELINDDLTTTLWLFAWMTKQPIFQDITNVNIRHLLSQRREAEIAESMTPFGFIVDGTEDYRNTHSETLDISSLPGRSKDPLDDWVNS